MLFDEIIYKAVQHHQNYEPNTPQEENFHWNLNLAILLMANSLDLNSVYCNIFGNLQMRAYIKFEIN